MKITELKKELSALEPSDFVERYIINARCKHLDEKEIELIITRVSEAVGIKIKTSEAHIVGSTKIGYGLLKKNKPNEPPLPAFRSFGPDSDIDVAFCSPVLFDTIWKELAEYAIAKPWMPYRINKTGDYLIYGWIRPDQVPWDARIRTLDALKDRLRQLSIDKRLGRRKINGAVYRDIHFLRNYQIRSIAQCQKEINSP